MSCYLFDFDGTLVDSMPTFGGMMLRILDECGAEYPSNILKTITPLGFAGTARYFIGMGVKKSEAELLSLMYKYAYEAYSNTIEVKPTVKETLEKLKAMGHSLNVLTASPHSNLDVCLKRVGLYDLFDNVWSCDDFGTTKANPEIYLSAAEKMGVPHSEVIFLDDNIDADRTAKSAGLKVIGVYDDSSSEYADDFRTLCDGYIKEMRELLSISI